MIFCLTTQPCSLAHKQWGVYEGEGYEFLFFLDGQTQKWWKP